MSEQIKCHTRTKEILGLLKNYGPLSVRAISEMVNPPMKAPRIHDSLKSLTKRNLIRKRTERAAAGRAFYQIMQDSTARTAASRILKCSPVDLLQPQFRYREMLHLESCALWAHKLRSLYPQATLIRDYEFRSSELASDIMLKQNNDRDITPDILMIFPKTNGSPRVVIAFEIECMQKSAKRLRMKLQKYASGTAVDGVVYICEVDGLKDLIGQVFSTHVLQQSERIKHYGNLFFMFQIDLTPSREVVPYVANCKFQPAPLTHWIDFLRETPMSLRRDAQQKKPVSGYWHFEKTNFQSEKQITERF